MRKSTVNSVIARRPKGRRSNPAFLHYALDCFATLAITVSLLFTSSPSFAAEDKTNKDVYDKPYIGETVVYKAKYEDTLVKIARKNNLGFVELRAANPALDPWIPGEDATIILPKKHLLPDAPHKGLVINLPEMRLYAYLEEGKPPLSYPIGVGRVGLRTPDGKTSVIRKKTGPTWRPTARMREENPDLPAFIPAGPDNPLGSHALYLGWPEYALHGTNKPFGIGRRVSSGCIRLYPEDIIDLYDRVETGTPVTIIDQPVKLAWIDDGLYMEAHPTLDQADYVEQNGGLADYSFSDEEMKAIMKVAGNDSRLLNWPVIRQAIRERSGMPVLIAKKQDAEKQI